MRTGKEYLNIEVRDYTEKYKKYEICKLVNRYLPFVPSEDIKGITRINIYDDSPAHFPRTMAGGITKLDYLAKADLKSAIRLGYHDNTSK